MYYALLFFLLSCVVLQQAILVQSAVSPIQSADNEAGRPNIARRLRAPLMGRSLLAASGTNNDADYLNNDLSSSSGSDDDDLVLLNKRRYGAPLFGRRWIPNKRRGPLFG